MRNLLTDVLNLIYPNLCLICGENLVSGEQQICMSCLHNIPKTNFHLLPDNPIEKKFWGKVPVFRGTAFFYFQKGSPFQQLLHELKYRDNKNIGEMLGKHAGVVLLESADFATVDIIIPVPLHPKKFAKRGYNQSECICRGLSVIMEKPLDTSNLRRVRENPTQTKKSVYERYENTENIFEVTDANLFAGKHILLVDDVLTTGSTIEACIQALLEVPVVKISIFTLAVA
ncbi:MAG: ComF family protein [Paludibacter sp.]|nr:ComF family protein [Paludibacter sp.]